jgi:hypothetical protein
MGIQRFKARNLVDVNWPAQFSAAQTVLGEFVDFFRARFGSEVR